MNNIEKKEKRFSIGTMISTEIVLLYLVLRIGDIVAQTSENISVVLTRYIPIAIASLIITFFLIRSGAKKSFKSEQDLFIKKIMIVPVIVAVIVLLYGFYSVRTNTAKFNQKYDDLYNSYSDLYNKYNLNNKIQTEYKKILEEAKKKAKLSWIITSIVYFTSSMITTLFMKNKINNLLEDDDMYVSEESNNTHNKVQILDDNDEKTVDDVNITKGKDNTTVQDIKWDL